MQRPEAGYLLIADITGYTRFLTGSELDHALFPYNDVSALNAVWHLAVFLPGLAVAVRRLHDLDRTGWWLFLIFTGIGIILLLIWDCMRGTSGSNRFGPDPLAGR